MRPGRAGLPHTILATLLLLLSALVAPALAQDRPAAVVPISGLEGLVPLDPLTLRTMRGGQLTRPQSTTPNTPSGVRLWDEIARPIRPMLPQDGTVTSTSRAMK